MEQPRLYLELLEVVKVGVFIYEKNGIVIALSASLAMYEPSVASAIWSTGEVLLTDPESV